MSLPPQHSQQQQQQQQSNGNMDFVNKCWQYHLQERASLLSFTKDPVKGFCEMIGPALMGIQLFEVNAPGTLASQLAACEASTGMVGKIRRNNALFTQPDGSAHGNYAFLLDLKSPHLHPVAKESIVNSPAAFLAITAFLMSLTDVDAQSRQRIAQQQHDDAGPPIAWKRCYAVVINGDHSPMSHLKASSLGKLVFVTGTVMRMCTPKLQCVLMRFKCGHCGHTVDTRLEGGPVEFPKSCIGKCKGFNFKPVQDESELEEVQTLKLQGNNQNAAAGGGNGRHSASSAFAGPSQEQAAPEQVDDVSQSVDVELRGILMEQAAPGDVVTVGGIVMTRKGEKQFAGTHQICVRGLSIVSHTLCKGSGGGKGDLSPLQKMLAAYADIGSSSRGLYDVNAPLGGMDTANTIARYYEASLSPGWFDRLVDAVSPGIYGHRCLKAAMLLALVGGSDRNELARPAIHLLMIGDPGLGKSQMLRAACLLSPRSAFVSAHTSSTCGLTVSISRDGAGGETTFEAGAVVHGDGGITCIDELDKGTNEHKALLEVMEQQSISIAKAGMIFSMPIRTTVMAAGNPIGGKFNPYLSLCQNINMSPALLSRFDIVYVMRDCNNATTSLTKHVLGVHVGSNRTANGGIQRGAGAGWGGDAGSGAEGGGGGGPIMSIPELARFLSFAKRERQPLMTEEAAAILKAAYITKRGASRGEGSDLPITPRYLQSLIRMSEAHAKIFLRTHVTAEDAEEAIALHHACSYFEGKKETKESLLNTGGKITKGHLTKAKQTDTVISMLRAYMVEKQTDHFPESVFMDICSEVGVKNIPQMLKGFTEPGNFLSIGQSKYKFGAGLRRQNM